MSSPSPKPNRLIHEKSPYLLQHAHNPVEWHPWDEHSLALAKKLDKPIFLSIGYSTCHWCHVMAHESFENEDVAVLLNEHFINIKVDREERPDLDAIYMTAVQMLTGSGGWPMSVWLTPDLKPFYGGTYFPPDDRYGRPGFSSVIVQLAQIWKDEREKVLHSAAEISGIMRSTLAVKQDPSLPDSATCYERAFQSLSHSYDSTHGGFGTAPKFPMPVYLQFLLSYFFRTNDQRALEMASFSLRQMALGGLYDQLGGGFSRYSTDERWIVPHFEKMLYDNAQLISVTSSLYQATHDTTFADIARDAIEYILRDLSHPDGGFYSAEDADSEGKEGTFYLWTLGQIKQLLPEPDAAIFIHRYGVTVNGNFFDPHTQEVGKNILTQSKSVADVAQHFQKSLEETAEILDRAKKLLFQERAKRIRPHLDDKILSGWNGLMISALTKASIALSNESYLIRALKAATFVKNNLWDPVQKQLFRRWRDGERKGGAFQSDYAELTTSCLDLFEATGDPQWLAWAEQLHETQFKLFWDAESGGYLLNADSNDVLMRTREDHDNVIPSGNSFAALNGFRLAELLSRDDLAQQARSVVKSFGGTLRNQPTSALLMLHALDFDARGSQQIVLVEGSDAGQFHETLAKSFHPFRSTIRIKPSFRREIERLLPWTAPMQSEGDKTTAFICSGRVCARPTHDVKEFARQLGVQ